MLEKDIEEVMQYYERFIDILKQMSMDANKQIAILQGTVVADELASDFSDIGMLYAKKLLESGWITKEQYIMAESIDRMLDEMSSKKELWTEEALFYAGEWKICRKQAGLLSRCYFNIIWEIFVIECEGGL